MLEKILNLTGLILFAGVLLFVLGSSLRLPFQIQWERAKKMETTSAGEVFSLIFLGIYHFFRDSVNRTAFFISAALVAVLWTIGSTFYVSFFFGCLCYLFSGLLFPKSVLTPVKEAAKNVESNSTKQPDS